MDIEELLGKLVLLELLKYGEIGPSKIVRRSSGGRVTELSSSSLSTSPLEVTFSLTTRKPPGLRPLMQRTKKASKCSSVRCPRTHWHHMTSYVSGTKSKF